MYYLFIPLCMAAIAVGNILFSAPVLGFTAWQVIAAVLSHVAAVIIIDGVTAFTVRWILPKKLFTGIKKVYAADVRERRVWEFFGVKKWKEKIPELGFFAAFRKNKIADPKNNEYVSRYITEANCGVAVHFAGIVCGFAIIFLMPLNRCLCFGIPVAVVNAVYNGLSLIILRYNLPKLHKLYRINEKREAREIAKANVCTIKEYSQNDVIDETKEKNEIAL